MSPTLPWPLPNHLALRDELIAAWSTQRGYHDVQHLAEVLDALHRLAAGDDIELLLAAWFHDAVYDGQPEAEERSALLAEARLADVAGVDAGEVARLVRVTVDHRPASGDRRGELLVDADLHILASGPERYAEYVAGVRQEYAAVSDADFRAGRAAVLSDLLGKQNLFHTAVGQALWERSARANLVRELAELRGTGP
ncbi:hypothetical protein ACLM5J_06080 [Nocardioides sp. Bht2]|uniref:HD domain-containing protein n=1 Tax=Nocardioides sp. Bht2 TaxID=3392297 RepID=UPI0039B4921C